MRFTNIQTQKHQWGPTLTGSASKLVYQFIQFRCWMWFRCRSGKFFYIKLGKPFLTGHIFCLFTDYFYLKSNWETKKAEFSPTEIPRFLSLFQSLIFLISILKIKINPYLIIWMRPITSQRPTSPHSLQAPISRNTSTYSNTESHVRSLCWERDWTHHNTRVSRFTVRLQRRKHNTQLKTTAEDLYGYSSTTAAGFFKDRKHWIMFSQPSCFVKNFKFAFLLHN